MCVGAVFLVNKSMLSNDRCAGKLRGTSLIKRDTVCRVCR